MDNDQGSRGPGQPASGSMRPALIIAMTCMAMMAFAANSLLARMAFQTTDIDPASFTAIRLVSGALTLLAILAVQRQRPMLSAPGGWSAVLLFAYAAAFSFAYRDIGTGAGALVLFASAQLTMICHGLHRGERTSIIGVLLALGGMVAFLAPAASAPPLLPAALMMVAGIAWGGFSLLGRSAGSPIASTAGSFVLAVPLALALLGVQHGHLRLDPAGSVYAVLSGSLASAIGYAIWYWVRVRMTAMAAGAVQLSVPVISAVFGVLLLGETITWMGVVSALVTLAGVAWVTLTARKASR